MEPQEQEIDTPDGPEQDGDWTPPPPQLSEDDIVDEDLPDTEVPAAEEDPE